MSLQMILDLSSRSISSEELEPGLTRSNKLVGLTTAKSLLEAALALHFPAPATNKDSTTPATSGQKCFASSASYDLQRSLESRLLQRGHCHGGTLWRVTWKHRTTRRLRWICQLQVSALPTSGIGSSGSLTSWATPTVNDSKNNASQSQLARNSLALNCQATLAPWPTPMASNQHGISPAAAAKETDRCNGVTPLRITVVHQLSGTMPSGSHAEMENSDPPTQRSTRSLALLQWIQGGLGTNWRGALEDLCQDETSENVVKTLGQLPNEFLLTRIEGQLNPALPCWTMGLPPEWDIAAIKAHRRL